MSKGYFGSAKSPHRFFHDALERFRDPNERSWILIAPAALGETWVTCALLRAVRVQHPGPVTLVLRESHVPIALLYNDDITRIVPLPGDIQDFCRSINSLCTFAMDIPYIVDPSYLGDGRLMHFTHLLQSDRGGVRVVDMFRYVMHLDWNALLTPGTIPIAWRQEVEALASQLGLVRGRSVILFPDNNSNWPVADDLWQKIADDLIARGFTVVTNTHGNDVRNYMGDRRQAFAGTVGYSVPLHLAAALVEFAGAFISGANGLALSIIGTARCRATILLHELLPGQRIWSNEEVASPLVQSPGFHIFDYSGIASLDLQEYVIRQGYDNSEVLTRIVETIAR